MRPFILSALILCFTTIASATHVVYTPDETGIFPNPERGFTEELGGETKLSDTKNHVVKQEADSFFDEEERSTQRLVVLMYYLYNYKSKDLSDKILQGFDEDMQILRDHGFKCVLRFAYDWKSKDDAELSWVKRHIEQLKPHWAANADVIYVLEAGFVGQWGEWYYSSHFGNKTQHLNANRRQVLDAMLDACPSNRFLLVRYPMIKTEYLGDELALTEEQAYDGSARAKIGCHNDAFLNEYGNDGTYASDEKDDDPAVRQYIAQETFFVPNGGETNVEEEELAQQVYRQAPSEMATYHWSFCGSTYAEEVTNRWHSSGIFDELNRKMGYRYELVSADLPQAAAAGSTTAISITLKNVGYAPLYNERPVFLVLSSQQSSFSIRLQADPRRWLPNGVTTVINETVTIPSDIPAGTYDLSLHMPDMDARLANDPRYAVRFANIGTWDELTGRNSLQASIEIQHDGQGWESACHPSSYRKILRDGQLLIQRGDKIYTLTGQVQSKPASTR